MKTLRKKTHFPYIKTILAFVLILLIVLGIILYIYPVKYVEIIDKYSKKYNISPELICAIINTESGFNKNEVSPKGAKGLMQIMESTANWAATTESIENYDYNNIFSPELNIQIGCWYISWLNKKFDNDKTLVLAAYNAGNGNITKWLQNPEYSKDGKTLSVIPFKETENYIKKVSSAERFYKHLLRLPLIGK